MKPPLYTVYTVLGDGVPWEVLQTDDPKAALAMLNYERSRLKSHRHHAHGVYLTDDPEKGDVENSLEDALTIDSLGLDSNQEG